MTLDDLITDRTEADVDRVRALLSKPYNTWTAADKTWFFGTGVARTWTVNAVTSLPPDVTIPFSHMGKQYTRLYGYQDIDEATYTATPYAYAVDANGGVTVLASNDPSSPDSTEAETLYWADASPSRTFVFDTAPSGALLVWLQANGQGKADDPVKGAYNASDLNRVGEAVGLVRDLLLADLRYLAAYLAARSIAPDPLYSLPYTADDVDVSPKTDWAVGAIPTREQMASYLQDIRTLRGLMPMPADLAELPESMRYLDYAGANAIEATLLAVRDTVEVLLAQCKANADLAASAWRCAEINCGEV